jgi:cobyrinic acid a,c-diamide synthase
MPRALILGAPRSGSGKTSVTIGLLRALARRGLAVAGAKSGPDYIDPAFHAAATGRAGVNLDSWAMPPPLLDALLHGQATGTDLVLVESAMGLFDGIVAEPGRSGAAVDIARRHAVPVLLILDVSGQSQTAAPIARGFADFDPDVRIAGVILNRVGSERHRRLCTDAIRDAGLEVVGAVPRDDAVALPERHLGLVQAAEHSALDVHIDRLAEMMERSIDLDRVVALASPLSPAGISDADCAAIPPPGQRIALAQDAAFSFVYPHLMAAWRKAGAELLAFSPLADEAPDESCDVCWLPGGYPELHAGRLAAAARFLSGLRSFAATRPVHGECGGYMTLGRTLQDADGTVHEMLGLLGHATSFLHRRMNLGYRQVRLLHDCAVGSAGEALRGHEFHYARVTDPGDDAPLAEIADGTGVPIGKAGGRRGHVSGTFFHAIARAP